MDDQVYQKMWNTLKKEVEFNLVELHEKEDENESPGFEKIQKMIEHLEDEFIKES